jgi:RHH-type proline utilization regulon transcriptional repressor/proline dehydrogenase/delta 1-pyrroline-5-carboxylate dehydrogenase
MPSLQPLGSLTLALGSSPYRAAISAATRRPEPELVPPLLQLARLDPGATQAAQALATQVAATLRERSREGGRSGLMAGFVQGLLQQFSLSSQEGVALMCLAEALLRIPDAATRDTLIRDKVGGADWQSHLGQSPSLFVNAATWGLLLTGKLVATHSDTGLVAALQRSVGRGGEPLIRMGVDLALRMMGEQFVSGADIGLALANSREREAQGFAYSYDMLGEAALTAPDAQRYLAAYETAVHAIGTAAARRGIYEGPGISLKLSALHPRYSRAQIERVLAELYPRLLGLVQLARAYDIGINIDAEESERLEMSLELLERLCFEPALAGWNGIGFVIQAYQKRCPALVDYLVDLGRRSRHRLMIRLAKGAYWDSEIKRAQVEGLADYPVYTRKAYTDVAFVACARKMLAAPDAVYPQFATHNAHTLATIYHLAGQNFYAGQYEFQCLHGMGEPLYEQVVGPLSEGKLNRPCRIYAPVGTPETLLAYLVRRLLENGSNTSFVNRIANRAIALDELVQDPLLSVALMAQEDGCVGLPHPAIALPRALYGETRVNSIGLDLSGEAQLMSLAANLSRAQTRAWAAAPLLADGGAVAEAVPAAARPVLNPADHRDVVGQVQDASLADVQHAIGCAVEHAPLWAAIEPAHRAAMLERCADQFEAETEVLMHLLQREAGKTCANALAEVREASDFLRYYAAQVRRDFSNRTHQPLGPVVCISPWNFPLAIFIGQVAAALAAGNTVLAKPSEQTPLIAAQAVRALWQSGIPRAALQLLPGAGESIGAALVADARIQGVLFTGSTAVARLLHGTLAQRLGTGGRPVPLIAETGGQNAMIVDSSALAEQVVADVLASAFDSAGQRCSALRVLCLQRDCADHVLEMLEGAMRELRIGNPQSLAVDVGPVIDDQARCGIEAHIEANRAKGRRIVRPVPENQSATRHGSFVAPTLIELASLAELQHEVFGPVLHVLRFERDCLPDLLAQINATGYALTLGLHTRIDETIAQIVGQSRAGNVYVNRNMVGAVVGVQPFGGEGLSGTGPKAGGPLYLLRLLSRRPDDAAVRSVEGIGPVAAEALLRGVQLGARGVPSGARGGEAPAAGAAVPAQTDAALQALQSWVTEQPRADFAALAPVFAQMAAASPCTAARLLAGPTGEANLYAVLPRERVLCLAMDACDQLLQLGAVLAVGSHAIWPAETQELYAELPAEARQRIELTLDWNHDSETFDAVLYHGNEEALRELCTQVGQRKGPIVAVVGLRPGTTSIPLECLVRERSLSVNTAAAGGNASLMTIG